ISLLVVDERSHKSKKCRNDEIIAETSAPLEETKLPGSPRAGPVYLWRVHVKTITMQYTMDHDLFTKTGSNSTFSLELILVMNSIADSVYRVSGLIVFIRAVCIWNDHNHFSISSFSKNVWRLMEVYGYWKATFYWEMDHTTAALLLGTQLNNVDYASNNAALCNPNWGVLYTFVGVNRIFLSGSFLAHAIGHIMGLGHDGAGCFCFRRSSCLMNEYPTLHDMLSNCSHSTLHWRTLGWDPCLSNPRHTYNSLKYHVPRCGNKNVEDGEACDCGSFKDCSADECCGTNCELTQGSACSSGGCCKTCKIAPSGTICRDKLGICDLPEYCNGVSGNCPENVFIMDGTPCSPLAVCMSGNCSDRHLQCQALFGYQVKDASPACYRELNSRGDRFGNCGIRNPRGGSVTVSCQKEDVLCGLIHCDGVRRIPGGGEHTTFYHIKIQDAKEQQCFGYDIHHGTELPEMGLVMNGATCGPGKYCKNQRCIFHQTLNFNCNVSKCNNRGVCNNKGNCHCIQGWQPPNCLERGTGGSVNSGPVITPQKRYLPKIHLSVNRLLIVLGTRMLLIMASIMFGAIAKAVLRPSGFQRPPVNG
ncbi:disintegrin and metalloproteinase domain-containing protein 21-like, partial [Mastomys coucha]|uniref:disintegrin and metalloproteinase domain-containing protein 21-like n=1 Tax=Mastomys coucha TaxID=35658 RepID=UPI0012615400